MIALVRKLSLDSLSCRKARRVQACFVILLLLAHAFAVQRCRAQGTILVSFDGPPLQPPGSDFLVQSYYEAGLYFRPIPGTDGFGRAWTNFPVGWPSDGSPYIITGAGESLAFSETNSSTFGLLAADLAGFSTGIPNFDVRFIGYPSAGGIISTNFSGSGIQFSTYQLGPEWSSGLSRVEVPGYPWSLDNLVLRTPEPSITIFTALALAMFAAARFGNKNSQV